MPETFLILLAGGIMFAVVVSDPKQVTLQWLRLAGVLALSFAGVSMFFFWRAQDLIGRSLWVDNALLALAILGQLAFAQTARLAAQRAVALLAFVLAIHLGVEYLNVATGRGGSLRFDAAHASALGIAAMCGLALMDMLLGHAYLIAGKLTIAPFLRLNRILAIVLAIRVFTAVGAVLVLQQRKPVYMLWGQYGLLIFTRWLVGLLVPAAFVYMAHDCIKRRSTQSATGILYVAGVLVFIGEIIALYLVRTTGLPF